MGNVSEHMLAPTPMRRAWRSWVDRWRQRPVSPQLPERGRTPAGDPRIAEQERITALLITQAQTEVAATMSNADSHDSKALGLLALDVVIAGGLIANRGSLDRFWYAPIAGLLISASFFLATIAPRGFPVGPALRPFYAQVIAGRALDANIALLDALTQAIDINRTIARRKARLWPIGLVVLILTALAASISLAVVR
jgi:hypothetical protein